MMAILPFCAEVEDHDGALLAWCERTWSYSRGAAWQVIKNVDRPTPAHLYTNSRHAGYVGPRHPLLRKVARFEFLDQRHFNQWKWECAKQGKMIEIPEKEMGPVSDWVVKGWPYVSSWRPLQRTNIRQWLERTNIRQWLEDNCGREWHDWAILQGGSIAFVDAGHHALFTLTWC